MWNPNFICNRSKRTIVNIYKHIWNRKISDEEIIKIIKEKFDLTPNGIINYLNLREPIYSKTTNYGHFGKEELEWEKIINIKITNRGGLWMKELELIKRKAVQIFSEEELDEK